LGFGEEMKLGSNAPGSSLFYVGRDILDPA
jgi:hypothetical protein